MVCVTRIDVGRGRYRIELEGNNIVVTGHTGAKTLIEPFYACDVARALKLLAKAWKKDNENMRDP